METQTRYDLNDAIEGWRRELAAQMNLAPEVRRELETHLRDAIIGFQQRGLNDEESFWLACKRVGQPPQLSEEFAKTDPAKVWRERAFWVVLVLSAFQFWNLIYPYLLEKVIYPDFNLFHPHDEPSWHSRFFNFIHSNHGVLLPIVFNSLVYLLPLFGFVVLLAKGQMNWIDSTFRFIFRSRLQFVLMALVLILVFHYYDNSVGALTVVPNSNLFSQYCTDVLLTKSWPLTLIALIAWLMPTQNRKTPQRA